MDRRQRQIQSELVARLAGCQPGSCGWYEYSFPNPVTCYVCGRIIGSSKAINQARLWAHADTHVSEEQVVAFETLQKIVGKLDALEVFCGGGRG